MGRALGLRASGTPDRLTTTAVGLINNTVQIQMMGLNIEPTVRFPHRPNTFQTVKGKWQGRVLYSTETLLTVIPYSKEFVAICVLSS